MKSFNDFLRFEVTYQTHPIDSVISRLAILEAALTGLIEIHASYEGNNSLLTQGAYCAFQEHAEHLKLFLRSLKVTTMEAGNEAE